LNQRWQNWFSTVSIILILAGITFSFFGLRILPVAREVLLPWESAIYGAIMMGWGLTLYFVGRLAFMRKDAELMRFLLYGIFLWLLIEVVFSLYFGVFFNVGVDIGVFTLFAIPLIKGIQSIIKKKVQENNYGS